MCTDWQKGIIYSVMSGCIDALSYVPEHRCVCISGLSALCWKSLFTSGLCNYRSQNPSKHNITTVQKDSESNMQNDISLAARFRFYLFMILLPENWWGVLMYTYILKNRIYSYQPVRHHPIFFWICCESNCLTRSKNK